MKKIALFVLLFQCCYSMDLSVIAYYLPENPIILEAGAHNGTDTERMSLRWPEGEIYAFEPNPEAFYQLEQRVQTLPNVQIWQTALGDRIGTVDFYLSLPASVYPADAQSSLLPPSETVWPEKWNYIRFEKSQAPVTTLDQWAKENKVGSIDFMWLDMQGGEFPMLKASPEILKTVKLILAEIAVIPYYEGIILFDEFDSWMEEQGFFLAYYDDFGEYIDGLYVRR